MLNWTVNYHSVNETQKQEKNISITIINRSGNLSSNLTIPAVPINNGTEIGCIILSYMPFDVTAKEAFLLVKG